MNIFNILTQLRALCWKIPHGRVVHYSAAALKGFFWNILTDWLGSSAQPPVLSLQCLDIIPFSLGGSLLSIAAFQNRTISANESAGTMSPECQSQMANPSPWATLVADTVPLDREYWKYCFSPQTKTKQYCETAATSEEKKPNKSHHCDSSQCCELCQIPLPNAAFTLEKLNLERFRLFNAAGYFWESLIHQRMYPCLGAWAPQGKSDPCLPVGHLTVCWGRNRTDCGNHREKTNRGS